ncbi:hypothetical protein [Streptomyces rapamycinicus]|uniref:Uncharacterized protein n=2 Tax=Streptomyces rapamycinicus TaxID=1226757 RepID=A0A0A0NHD4_STRRN|nr:hypothetical protein [Streptomyces rapamycinicus]AGP53820.1 hypothetical protein M271_11095 [Streptomyces rapamycinicus NRRL 5491]MBB4781309.1 hypothetical protein [Streptomyces rapamycinicus]RLV74047.1 hypothetical protein D3C57_132515 [Streptomyces rapamycinicus NRRL 5491]UTO61939.1 hypothetical protein LJB45_06140 [Streptomyces rapamycinicus]UTP29891.1 hypothetical protein LIV37_11255 [Streptomyces rapamycinicus NRRL 5491]
MAREPARTLARDGERQITWCERFARETDALRGDAARQVDDKLGHDGTEGVGPVAERVVPEQGHPS